MDDERHPQELVIEVSPVLEPAVLAELLPMVRGHHHHGGVE